MSFEYQHLIPENFSPSSRIWIYQSSRLFSASEVLQTEEMLSDFVAIWKTHGTPVKGYATLLFGQFIMLMADETVASVGGCSTDSSVQVIKQIEEKFAVEMFNRQILAFVVKDTIQTIPLAQLNYALENGFITPDTIYFNNTVLDKASFLAKWMIPVKNSWLAKKITNQVITGTPA